MIALLGGVAESRLAMFIVIESLIEHALWGKFNKFIKCNLINLTDTKGWQATKFQGKSNSILTTPSSRMPGWPPTTNSSKRKFPSKIILSLKSGRRL